MEDAGFHGVISLGNEYRCARKEGRNPTSVRVHKDTLSATCFSTNLKGDLITLVQHKLNLSFPKTIKRIANLADYTLSEGVKIELPFGGYFKNITKLRDSNDVDIEIYSDHILNNYEILPNMLFYEDGILPNVQLNYEIGYDSMTERISVPWRSFDGRLVGVMGRLNKRNVSEDENKWFPIISFPKSKTLYGFSTNYESMQSKSIVMIGESEKHCLQLSSKGLDVGVSLGGSFLSDIQANNIKSLFPKTILVMMDEGLDRQHSLEIAKKLKMDNFFKNKVGYIYDRNNDYMPKDSKIAPSDLDKNTLNLLIKNCTVWL